MNLIQRNRGFTLLEIMVVVVIIGLLAGIVTPIVIERLEQARVTTATAEIQKLDMTVQMHKMDTTKYPDALDDLVPEYVKHMKNDPWGHAYVYMHPGRHGDFDVYSLGADGRPGGDGYDADIGNWATE